MGFPLGILRLPFEPSEVHAGRDRILLEGEEDTYDAGEEEEEVFGLKGLDEDEDEDEDEDMEDYKAEGFDEQEEEVQPQTKKADKKSKGKKRVKGELSDDEEDKTREDLEESWGRGKAAYYNSNADELDSDDEEGHELEEQEAKRLQAKAREGMKDEDFGLNDIIDITKDEVECVPLVHVPIRVLTLWFIVSH